MPGVTTVEIPNRSLFRQPEVCEIAQVQPYVLRSWEAEFPDLGVAKTEGGPRVYRRADVERVLRIKHLLFVDGLTLAGARRKLQDEQPPRRRAERRPRRRCSASDARERILQVPRRRCGSWRRCSRRTGCCRNGEVPAWRAALDRSARAPAKRHEARRKDGREERAGRAAAASKTNA